jgi:hypothetical protein
MVFAMLPLAIKIGTGSEERSPMATVLVGGLVTSTLLTLLFVPALYTYLDDLGKLLTRLGLMGVRWDESKLATVPALGATPDGLGEVATVGADGSSGNGTIGSHTPGGVTSG